MTLRAEYSSDSKEEIEGRLTVDVDVSKVTGHGVISVVLLQTEVEIACELK